MIMCSNQVVLQLISYQHDSIILNSFLLSIVDVCAKGYGTASCTECEVGFYKDATGPADCTQCPAGKTTSAAAAIADTACGK